MSIPQKTIEDIRTKSDIVEIISKYLPSMKRVGRNYIALCPFHQEKTPSFTVSREKGFFKCFGCGKSGDVFKFLELYENISWVESVKKLGELAGIEVKDTYNDSDTAAENRLLYEVLSSAAEHYHKTLFETYAGKNSLEYLKSRGLTEETIKKFKLGFSQGEVAQALSKEGFDRTILEKAGIVKIADDKVYDYMTGRIVFPIKDTRGRIVAFGGRSVDEFKQPKYLNSPETTLYSKSMTLYGYSDGIEAIRKSKEIIIVEGYMDVIVAHQYGLYNTVSCLGVALTDKHVDILKKCVERIALIFDSDEAGVKAAIRAAENLINTDLQFFIVSLPPSKDPDDFLKASGAQAFIDYIRKNKKNFFDFHCQYLVKTYGTSTTDRKLKILREIFPNLCRIKSPLVVEDTLRMVSEHLGIKMDVLMAEYKKSMKKSGSDFALIETAEIPVLSTEETLICLLVTNPHYCLRFNEEMFLDSRCRCVWKKITEKVTSGQRLDASTIAAIANEIPAELNSWFTSLIMREINLDPEECIDKIYEEMKLAILKNRLKKLEVEVLKMLSDGRNIDRAKLDEYNQLIRILKCPVSDTATKPSSEADTVN